MSYVSRRSTEHGDVHTGHGEALHGEGTPCPHSLRWKQALTPTDSPAVSPAVCHELLRPRFALSDSCRPAGASPKSAELRGHIIFPEPVRDSQHYFSQREKIFPPPPLRLIIDSRQGMLDHLAAEINDFC